MRIMGIFRNGHRSEEYWRVVALQMAVDRGQMQNNQDTLKRAEEYLKFIQTGHV